MSTCTDPEIYKQYVTANAVAFAKFGGRFLVRAGKHVVASGKAPARKVVIEFRDYATALACHESEEYRARRNCATPPRAVDLVIAEGYDGPQPG